MQLYNSNKYEKQQFTHSINGNESETTKIIRRWYCSPSHRL